MDDVDRMLVEVRPPVDDSAVARTQERFARLRREEPRRRRSWRVTAGGLVSAGLVGAAVAGGAVAAAANGLAPAPVGQALTRVGILPESAGRTSGEEGAGQQSGELLSAGPAADGGGRVVMFIADAEVTQVRVELDDGSSVELTASNDVAGSVELESSSGEPMRVFSGELPADASVVAVVGKVAPGGEEDLARTAAP